MSPRRWLTSGWARPAFRTSFITAAMAVVPVDADLTQLQTFLRRQPVLNTVPLSLVSRAMASDEERTKLFAATVEEEGEIVAAALRSDFEGSRGVLTTEPASEARPRCQSRSASISSPASRYRPGNTRVATRNCRLSARCETRRDERLRWDRLPGGRAGE